MQDSNKKQALQGVLQFFIPGSVIIAGIAALFIPLWYTRLLSGNLLTSLMPFLAVGVSLLAILAAMVVFRRLKLENCKLQDTVEKKKEARPVRLALMFLAKLTIFAILPCIVIFSYMGITKFLTHQPLMTANPYLITMLAAAEVALGLWVLGLCLFESNSVTDNLKTISLILLFIVVPLLAITAVVAGTGLFIQQTSLFLSPVSSAIVGGLVAFGVLSAIALFLTFNLAYSCREVRYDPARDIGLFDGLSSKILKCCENQRSFSQEGVSSDDAEKNPLVR